MKQSLLALATLCLMTTAVAAEKLEPGIRPGDPVAEFQFVDLTGRNRGKQLSQVEALGAGPVVMALVNESPYHSRELVGGLQKLADTYQAERLAVFVVFVAGPEVQEPIVRVAREKSVSIPVGYVTHRRELAAYGLNAAARNAVVVYRNRRVHRVLTDVDGEGLLDVVQAAKQMLTDRERQTGSL